MTTKERPDPAALLATLTHGTLREREDVVEPGWRFWERRNFNMHRVAGLWSPGSPPASAAELGVEVRSAIGRHFRRAWWRGLAFGVVVEVGRLLSPEETGTLVDGRENARGTWQWILQVSRSERAATGVHTWIEGYLSPLYRSLLEHLAAGGLHVTSVRREKDGLMKLLTAARPRMFPEFRDVS